MKIIEDNILAISKAIFNNSYDWQYVKDEQKDKFFFIFNRYMSKKYPEMSILLNHKGIDKIIGMDLIYNFLKDKPYPNWFWSKTPFKKVKDVEIEKSLKKEFMKEYKLNDNDFNIIYHLYRDELMSEIKQYKKKIENNK